MKFITIPYQPDTDLVSLGECVSQPRPHLPTFSRTDDDDLLKPEDIPLNRRNFIYTPCSPNPLFSTLKYATSEYPFDVAGFNYMDRADDMGVLGHSNNAVKVPKPLGWRTARCDACIKEGTVYWEVEVLSDGDLDLSSDGALKSMKDKVSSMPHIRLGISRREASLECPVGFDLYGYGIRNFSLESIHDGKMTQALPAGQIRAGDRLGFVLRLPSTEIQISQAKSFSAVKIAALSSSSENSTDGPVKKRAKKLSREFQKELLRDQDFSNVIRDQIAIRYKNQLFFEATDYVKTTKPEYHTSDKRERQDFYSLENSHLKIYLNGKELGVAFEQLKPFLPPFSELKYNEKLYFNYWRNEAGGSAETDDLKTGPESRRPRNILRNKYVNNSRLGYYPTVSCFNGGSAKLLTAASDFKYWKSVRSTEPEIKTINEVHQEQIADDIVWDIVDEVEAEMLSDT
ncbi:LAME_0D07184g1_1 [Lachancea meyersii CBS 8951]|uniref:LAME_0D07184g1_1 n=1 Tax=Lachancea meyersii CBS 8951 TaxID=1266667 RepID=A0A1G4J9K2_9SACH|nr:LAME_0D07184g1_1 [Lachancea meyersii CBS 8951]